MDADGSHNPMTVRKLLKETSGEKVDVVIASRYVDGGSTDNQYLLKLMSKTLNFVYGKVLGINAQDISTNFKLYSSKELKKVSLTCNEFDILEELLLKLKRQKFNDFSIIEVPDHFHNRVHGVSKRKLGPFIVGYVITLFRLRFKIQ
jgi:dolichol-phosphate mannosyltransferase